MFAKLNWTPPSSEDEMLPRFSLLGNRLISKRDLLNTSCVQSDKEMWQSGKWPWRLVRNIIKLIYFIHSKDGKFHNCQFEL